MDNKALEGTGVDGAVGGAAAATLVGVGIPWERAKLYETDLKTGGIVYQDAIAP